MNFKYENKKLAGGYKYVIGCDEVGRGCLAGPVVAAAVVLSVADNNLEGYKDIKDSKLLTAAKREELSKTIKDTALAWSIAEVSPKEVDEINIHNASLLAMKKAVEGLLPGVVQALGLLKANQQAKGPYGQGFVFIDGKFKIPNLGIGQEAIIGGDNKVLSIAAASIIAKVYRDRLMQELHEQYPIYNFAKHKGYATLFHRTTLVKHGLSPIHRVSFCKNIIKIQ